jgi:6-phosphogluconolactonase
MRPEVVTGGPAEIERALVGDFQNAAAQAIAARGSFRLVLAGGSITPLFFPTLARLPLDWNQVEFFWADERAVPPDDPESNFSAANRLWLQPAGVPEARIHRIHGEDPDLRRASMEYAAELGRVAGRPPVLDFALLGVGPDGHVASLFPGHHALQAENELAMSVEDAPKPPPRRITLTLPALAAAAAIVIAGSDEKAKVVERALEAGSPLPVGMLMSRARNVTVLLVK